jgi:tight adherence protein B
MLAGLSWLGFQLLVFVAALAAVEGLLLLAFGSQRARSRAAVTRLRRHASQMQDLDAVDGDSIVRGAQTGGPLLRVFGRLARRVSLELLLYRAGTTWSVPRFLAVSLGLSICSAAIAFTLVRPELAVSAAIGAASGFALLPFVFVSIAARKRMRCFEEQLPDALDLICRALRSGISLEFGFRSVGEELKDPIGTEFGQLAHEIGLGLPIRTALEHLDERVRSRDLPFFTTAVLIQRETGGNLAEVLENLAHVVRERLQFQLKVRSILAQMKLTANLLAVLPLVFAGMITLASPGYLNPLFETALGRQAMYAALAMVVVGWLLCRRMGQVRM